MTPPEEIVGPLSAEQRTRIARIVGDTVQARYIDPKLNGVDWAQVQSDYAPRLRTAKDDSTFWELLDRMVGELKDSHTRVESPARVERRQQFGGVSYGITLTRTDAGIAVLGVHPDSDAFFAGLRVGATIDSINSVPTAQAYEQMLMRARQQSTVWTTQRTALQRLLDPLENGKVTLSATRADGGRIEATLKPRRIVTPPSASHRVLPSGFGYVRFSGFAESLRGRVLAGMEELKDTPGLILDLRGNGGGSGAFASALTSQFMKTATLPLKIQTRDNAPVRVLGVNVAAQAFTGFRGRGERAYTKPIVVLQDAGSASASELTAAALRELGNTTIIGQASCGCLLGFMGYLKLPGGGELAYSEVGFVTQSGKRIEGEGVSPDIELPITLERIRSGRDFALEEAQRVLAQKTK
jgi:carboxyl-terminal processing protease